MAKKNFLLMWTALILVTIIGVAVGGLFLGTDAKEKTDNSPAIAEMPAITLSNPLLGWLGESVHTLVGRVIIILTLLSTAMSIKPLLKL